MNKTRDLTVVTADTRRADCSCAGCRGFAPWAANFAGCIQAGWHAVAVAVANGSAVRIGRDW